MAGYIDLVIKIPEEIYKASQILDVKYEDTVQIPLEVISNGTPLPKEDEIKHSSKRVEALKRLKLLQMKKEEEKIKMLIEQEEFAFIKEIPSDKLWKLIFFLELIDY